MRVEQLEQSIVRRGLFDKGARILVACSGGSDSTALTVLLAELARTWALELHVACIDHGLRPEAAAESRHVERLAESLSLPFHALSVHVERKGMQASARVARYAALGTLRDSLGGGFIATGHTRDDQAETVVARLLRGAGLRGLGGIAPKRADGVVRPLLDFERASLRDLLRERGIAWVEDPSNQSHAFERVRIREAILPALEAERPGTRARLAELADEARDADAILERRARKVFETAHRAPDLDPAPITSIEPSVLVRVLRRWMTTHHPVELSGKQLEALVDLVRTRRGQVRLTPSLAIAYDPSRGVLRANLSPERRGRGRRPAGE